MAEKKDLDLELISILESTVKDTAALQVLVNILFSTLSRIPEVRSALIESLTYRLHNTSGVLSDSTRGVLEEILDLLEH